MFGCCTDDRTAISMASETASPSPLRALSTLTAAGRRAQVPLYTCVCLLQRLDRLAIGQPKLIRRNQPLFSNSFKQQPSHENVKSKTSPAQTRRRPAARRSADLKSPRSASPSSESPAAAPAPWRRC
jgi:hypothetical protein